MLGKRKRVYANSKMPAKKARTAIQQLNNKVKFPLTDRAKSVRTVCRWTDLGRIVDGGLAGAAGVYVYSLNDLFDPNRTGAGDQPTGFDEYMNLYSKFTVLAVKVKVSCVNADSTYSQLAGCCITATDGTSTDADVYMRNGTIKWCVLGKLGDGNNIKEMSFDVDINALSKTNILVDPQFSGIVSAGPANQWYLQIYNANSDFTNNAGDVYWNVEFEYLVEFREPATTLNS